MLDVKKILKLTAEEGEMKSVPEIEVQERSEVTEIKTEGILSSLEKL